MRKAPKPKEPGGQHKTIDGWDWKHDAVLTDMKNAILSDPVLKRPSIHRRFYLKTDYSSRGYGAALCQAGTSAEEMAAERDEEAGNKCIFDSQMNGLRLHPVLFESKALTGPACSDHSHPGEAKAGDFATTKFRYFLWGKPFTWITDCSSLRAFFEQRDMPNHQLERVRMRMLCYQFTIVHRNSNMVKEVDLLTRYNKFADEFRMPDRPEVAENPVLIAMTQKHSPPLGGTNAPIMFTGSYLHPKTEAAKRWSTDFCMILGSAGMGEMEMAVTMLGQLPVVVAAAEEEDHLNKLAEQRLEQIVHDSTEGMLESLSQMDIGHLEISAYIATCRTDDPGETLHWLSEHLGVLSSLRELVMIKAAILFFHSDDRAPPSQIIQFEKLLQHEGWKVFKWRLRNVRLGGAIATTYWALVVTIEEVADYISPPEEQGDSDPAFGPRLTIDDEDDEEEVCMDVMDIKSALETRPPKPYRPRAWGNIREKQRQGTDHGQPSSTQNILPRRGKLSSKETKHFLVSMLLGIRANQTHMEMEYAGSHCGTP